VFYLAISPTFTETFVALRPSSIPMVEHCLEQMVAAQLAHRAGDALFTAAIAISEAMAKVMKADGAAPPSQANGA